MARAPDPTVDAPAVLSVHPDLEAARDAIQKLQNAGIDSVHISLVGPRLDAATGRDAQRAMDVGETAAIGENLLKGAGIGAAAGAALGGLATVAIPGVGPAIAGGLAIAAFGAVTGAGVGGAGGVASTPAWSEAWEQTFAHLDDGNVVVAVHGDDELMLDNALKTLRATSAEHVELTGRGEAGVSSATESPEARNRRRR